MALTHQEHTGAAFKLHELSHARAICRCFICGRQLSGVCFQQHHLPSMMAVPTASTGVVSAAPAIPVLLAPGAGGRARWTSLSAATTSPGPHTRGRVPGAGERVVMRSNRTCTCAGVRRQVTAMPNVCSNHVHYVCGVGVIIAAAFCRFYKSAGSLIQWTMPWALPVLVC
jgi:hypothetical protein